MLNPWLKIPAEEYEGHMSHASVRQLQALNSILENALERYAPRSLAVLGCATGNGFEHIRSATTETVYALDINESYLELVRARYGSHIPGLELICGDVQAVDLPRDAFEHIHAGLLFEYVDPAAVLARIARWLRPGGVLSVVLQLPSLRAGRVSESPFTSLRLLDPVMRLVDPDDFVSSARAAGLVVVEAFTHSLAQGKRFQCFYLRKRRSVEPAAS